MATSLDESVKKASEAAESGDIVLLSPACASLGMFTNYEDRGRRFKELVSQLNEHCPIVLQSDTQNKSSSTAYYRQQNHE